MASKNPDGRTARLSPAEADALRVIKEDAARYASVDDDAPRTMRAVRKLGHEALDKILAAHGGKAER